MWVRTVLAVGMAVAVVSAAPRVARPAEISRGTVELALAGGFQHTSVEGTSISSLDLGTRLSYSLTNRFAVGGTIGFAHLSQESGFDSTNLGLAADLILNFSSGSAVVPFAQLSVGSTSWSGSGYDDAKWGYTLPFVGVGFRTILGNYASINVLAGYRHQMNAFGVEDLTAHDVLVSFGLSVFPNSVE
jgi:hypothetical protein